MAFHPAAIVLAAGFSERMGEFKPLLPLGDVPALERCVSLFRNSGIADVRVVTGYLGDELEPHLTALDVRIVKNPSYREGMFSSVLAGLATIESDVDAFFVLPVDVPLVRPYTVRRMLDTRRQSGGDVIYPLFMGERGHPPLITGNRAREIAACHGEGGLKGALAEWEPTALEVEVADGNILLDMDSPDDYGILRERADRLEIPTMEECTALMEKVLCVGKDVILHGRAVAKVALRMGDALNRAGLSLDMPLLEATALLHDIAKGRPDHARLGAQILREQGFGAAATPVATHMDITIDENETIGLAEILYLADKMVQGERRLSLEERFRAKMERYQQEPEILEKVSVRLKTALAIQGRIESRLGRPLEEVLAQ